MTGQTNNTVQTAFAGILTLAAAAMAASLIHREFFAPPARVVASSAEPEFLPQWHEVLPAGIELGDPKSKIKLIEFGDFECPACRALHPTLQKVVARHIKDGVSLVFVHYPLQQHRFALQSARAAECAAGVGRFQAFHDLLFDKQDSIGLKTWTSYASEAGIGDTTNFAACVHSAVPISRIEAGIAMAKRIKARGTPTLIVNGWKLAGAPREEELDRIVEALLAGKLPFKKG
jgi:protein-disulfide isomerase